MAAFTNENELKNLLESKFNLAPLTGIKFSHEKYKVESNITFQIEHDGIIYLFEVDSYNTSKVLFGEYLLLNHYLSNQSNYLFIAIQYYKGFNTQRTGYHLDFAQRKLGCKVPYKIFDGLSLEALIHQSKSLNGFFRKVNNSGLYHKLKSAVI